jgi:hypothetical protein
MIHGHTVVWLPTLGHLVDVTAEQFPEIAALDGGPVIAGRPSGDCAPELIQAKRKHLRMTYELAPLEITTALLDHPVPRASIADYRRHGVNLATAAVSILAESLSSAGLELMPHRRVAALIEAVRELPKHETVTGDRRFLVPRPDGRPVTVQLDEIPLPAGTPPVTDLPWCRSD